MAITPETFKAASERGRRTSDEYGATEARYDAPRGAIYVRLANGMALVVSRRAIAAFHDASDLQLQDVRLTPSRLGLHFGALDVDLSIPNLIHSEDGRNIRIVRDPNL